MKVLLVFLAFSLCCFSSNAQLLEEGSTTTTEIETQGGVEEVTETTVTIEHKDTGDILDGDTGVVSSKYEGDADIDWGGAGSVYSHSSCTDAASGFPATGTDGRTSACGHARTNSLTTWRQYVDLNSFDIKDGGEVNYEFLFAFPNSMYNNSGQTAYVQTKGYNDNALQWETGLVTIDKTTFTQNPYNYNNNTNWVNTVTGSYDFSNQLDKVYIEIGGYGEYYWDEFQYNVVYNHITTTVETWMQLVQQEQEISTTIDLMDNYDVDDYNTSPVNNSIDDIPEINLDLDIEIDEPDVGGIDIPDTTVVDVQIQIPEIDNVSAEMFEDLNVGEPMVNVEEVVAEVSELVAEIQQIEVETEVQPATNIEPEIETPTEIAENVEVEEISTSVNGAGEQSEEVVVEKVAEETEVSEPEPTENKVEETTEVADNEPEVEEIKEEQPAKETKEEQVAENEPEEKEVVQEEVKEEPKEEVKEEPKEEKEIVEEETKEEVKEAKAENKPTKQQEKKQEKAKEIRENFASQYDAVAQITTLALVNALGPNINTYSNQVVQTQPTWYKSEEIYSDVVMQDPLGNYFGVRDSLVFEQMIGEQYE
tara:strand:- start:181 stop:1956 length:1776 start_codon:yes stop_codon:yes gene_type:complete